MSDDDLLSLAAAERVWNLDPKLLDTKLIGRVYVHWNLTHHHWVKTARGWLFVAHSKEHGNIWSTTVNPHGSLHVPYMWFLRELPFEALGPLYTDGHLTSFNGGDFTLDEIEEAQELLK